MEVELRVVFFGWKAAAFETVDRSQSLPPRPFGENESHDVEPAEGERECAAHIEKLWVLPGEKIVESQRMSEENDGSDREPHETEAEAQKAERHVSTPRASNLSPTGDADISCSTIVTV